MQTVSLGLCSLCVPCRAHCRYCLLSSRGQAAGLPYDRSRELARRLLWERDREYPDLGVSFYIGYCMDTPYLMDYIAFCRETGMPSGRFLQMNGFAPRPREEIHRLMAAIARAGIETMDFTFYGLEPSHDAFAGRGGDWALLLAMMEAAAASGIRTYASVPVLRDNAAQMEALIPQLEARGADVVRLFLPHSKGRGRTLNDQRLTRRDYDGLSPAVRARFSKTPLKTEAEWIAEGVFPEEEKRVLTLVPRQTDEEPWEKMPLTQILARLEAMDDQYRALTPPPGELARRCGNPEGDRLFRRRDLVLLWRQLWAAGSGGKIIDRQDESGHFVAYLEPAERKDAP